MIDPLSAIPTKWSNTLKQFVGNLPTNCLSVFDHFVGLALKGLIPVETREAAGIDKLACETIPYGSSKYYDKIYIPNMYNCLLPIKIFPDLFKI